MKSKKLLICLGLLLMFLVSLCHMTAFAELGDSSESVIVEKNFDLKNSEFSDYELYTYEMNTLTDASTPRPCDIMAENGFSGLLAQQTTENKYSWMDNFALFTANRTGADIGLGSYYSAFTAIVRPVQSGGVNIPFGTADFDQLSFVFTDLNDENNTLTVTFKDDSGNISYTYVSYKGSGEQRVGMGGFCFRGGHWFSTQNPPDGLKVPLVFRFDADQKKLLTDYRQNIEVKLGDYFPDFAGFDQFSVKMVFPSVKAGKTANLIVYEINSQLMVGEKFPHNVAPQLILEEVYPKGIMGNFYTLPPASAIHMTEGDLTDDLVVTVKDPAGNWSEVKGDGFSADLAGEYIVTYQVQDSYGLKAEKKRIVEIYKHLPVSEIEVSADPGSVYGKGHTLRIPSASVKGKADGITILVQKGSRVLMYFRDASKTNLFELRETGNYAVIYTYRNELGNIDSVSYQISCENIPAILDPGLPEKLSFGAGESLYVEDAYAVNGEERQKADLTILSPTQKEVRLSEGNLFIPEEVGRYEFEYTASFGAEKLLQKYYIDCVYTADGLFAATSGVDELVDNMEIKYLVEHNVSGLGVIGKTNNMTVQFKNVIDLNSLDPETDLIRFQPLSDDGYAAYASVIVTLTDVHDPARTVQVRYQANGQYAYVLVNVDGRFLGRSNEATSEGLIREDEYGTVTGNTFEPNVYSGKFQFAFQINYDQKQFLVWQQEMQGGEIVNVKQDLILDADDISQMGDGNAWEGFTTGEVYVSVTVPSMSGRGGLVISEIAGVKIGGDMLEDLQGPGISLKNFNGYAEMPKAIVGHEYFIPEACAHDLFSGERKISLAVFFKDGETWTDVISGLSGFVFVPQNQGEYRIDYSAADESGNQSVLSLYVTAELMLPELTAFYVDEPGEAVVGKSYKLPQIQVAGGSGNLSSEIKVYLNDEELKVGRSGKIDLDSTGTIRIEVFAQDYLKQTLNKTFTIQVKADASPVLEVEGVPDSVRLNDTLVLPDFTAVDYNYSPQEKEYNADRSILVNGQPIDLTTRAYQVTSKDPIIIQYVAQSGDKTTIKEFIVYVIDEDYVFSDQEILIEKGNSNTVVTFVQNTQLKLANPLAADDLLLKFFVPAGKANFEYFDIIYEDYYNRNISLFFRITQNDEKTSYLEVNANTGKKIEISGSILSENAGFGFILNNKELYIADESGQKIAVLNMTAEGDDFYGFPSGAVRVRMSFGGVRAESAVGISKISNQSFTTFAGKYIDAAPVAVYRGSLMNHSIEKGEVFILPAATAYDVLNGIGSVTVSVTDPEGNKILDAAATQDYLIAGEMYGDYMIVYTITDGDKTAQAYFSVHVTDREAPVLTVSGTVASTAQVGGTIQLPEASVTDNMSTDLQVYVFVQAPSGKYTAVTNGSYTFTEKGEHIVLYYAVDDDYNVSEKTFSVVVQ